MGYLGGSATGQTEVLPHGGHGAHRPRLPLEGYHQVRLFIFSCLAYSFISFLDRVTSKPIHVLGRM